MANSYYEIYLHIVWTTKNREEMITQDVERLINSIIESKVHNQDTRVIAIGNTKDHIHLLIAVGPKFDISTLIKEIKGLISYHINHNTDGNLYWQDGYGVLSVSKEAIPNVKRYIENQKVHHYGDKKLMPELERCE